MRVEQMQGGDGKEFAPWPWDGIGALLLTLYHALGIWGLTLLDRPIVMGFSGWELFLVQMGMFFLLSWMTVVLGFGLLILWGALAWSALLHLLIAVARLRKDGGA